MGFGTSRDIYHPPFKPFLFFQTATLNDIQQKEILLREREIQLEKMKGLYRWQFNDKYLILPSCIDVSFPEQLPMDEQFSRVKNIDFTADALKALVGGLEGALSIPEITSVEDYFGLNCKVAEKELQYLKAGRWTSDVEFGRQILNGVNPVIIRKCTKHLLSKLPVTINEMVRPFLTRGLSLEKEMKVCLSSDIYV